MVWVNKTYSRSESFCWWHVPQPQQHLNVESTVFANKIHQLWFCWKAGNFTYKNLHIHDLSGLKMQDSKGIFIFLQWDISNCTSPPKRNTNLKVTVPSLKLTYPLKIGRNCQKEISSNPTINFQGQRLSFREGTWKERGAGSWAVTLTHPHQGLLSFLKCADLKVASKSTKLSVKKRSCKAVKWIQWEIWNEFTLGIWGFIGLFNLP